jgi:glycosyltransferase involved in cell wall biosynthesis
MHDELYKRYKTIGSVHANALLMRIACVGTGWYPQSPGGLEKYLYGMTHALLDAGDTVDLFVLGNPHLDSDRGHAYSIGQPHTRLPQRMLAARRQFAKSFREPYDVVNLHFAMNALPLIPFIKHTSPRVVNFQGPWGAESRAEGGGDLSVRIKEMLERFVYKRSDEFIVLSSAFKEILIGYGIDAARIHVIPMGIDCNFFVEASDRRAVRADLGWPADATIFFTARRLVNRVGVQELVRAAREVRNTFPNAVVKIAGKGPLHGELVEAINSLQLGDCVELLGFVSEADLVRAYQASDVTVLPTQSLEGFGTIISESLACGTPVIVTPVGGMPEIVAPLGTDLIMTSASSASIAQCMSRVMKGEIALPDATTCRAFAVQHFDWNIVIQQVRGVFSMANHRLQR